MLERTVEQRLTERMKMIGGLCLKWVCPGVRGVPDRICIFPDGRIRFVELKRPKGDPGSLQRIMHRKLARLGHDVAVLDRPELVDQFVREGVTRNEI